MYFWKKMWIMKFEKETWKIFQPIVFCYGGCSVSLWFSPTGPFVMRSDLSSNTAAMFLLTIFWSQSKLVFTYFLMFHKGGLTSEIFFILAWVSCEGTVAINDLLCMKNGFQLKWRFGTHGHWKNQNPGGRFGATS